MFIPSIMQLPIKINKHMQCCWEKRDEVSGSIHNCRNCTAVSLPHTPKSGLTSKIPQLYCDIPFSDFSHIKSYLKYHHRISLVKWMPQMFQNKMKNKYIVQKTRRKSTNRRNHIFTVSTGLESKIGVGERSANNEQCLTILTYNNYQFVPSPQKKQSPKRTTRIYLYPQRRLVNLLTATTFTSEVFPAFWRPIRDSSISCLKKRLHHKIMSVKTPLKRLNP